jgi:iron(III) transport system ATP-binding protein
MVTFNRLELARVSVAYGLEMAVRDISLKLPVGRIGCLLGPSGSGKTTLLRAIAGFEPVAQGAIHIDGARVSARDSHFPPELRNIGVVLQDFALFPHLTVGQNVAFGLHKLTYEEAFKRMIEAMHRVGLRELRELDGRYPHELTAEQRLRVALARALAPKPRLLLLDEPFAGMERDFSERLSLEIRTILKESDTTALLFTANQHEAFAMADEIGVLSAGRMQQWGDTDTIYHRPANRFVAHYIGHGTVLTATLVSGTGVSTELGVLPLPDGGVSLLGRPYLEISLRPNHVGIEPVDGIIVTAGNAEIIRKIYRGMDALYTLRLPSGTEVLSVASADSPYEVGDVVFARLKPHNPAILYMGD